MGCRREPKLAAVVSPSWLRENNVGELEGLAKFIEQTAKDYNNDPNLKGFLEIYEYMSQKFREAIEVGNKHKYKITATFSNFIYEKLKHVDGILYQSVQYPQNFNIALKKEVIDSGKVRLTGAWKQTFIRTGSMSFKETNSITSNNIDYSNGTISWP